MRDGAGHIDEAQAALWNGVCGHAWIEAQDLLDRMFRPLEDLLVDTVGAGGRVLDVGCGTGGVTLAAARRAGTKGACMGVDISEPMIAAARTRAKREGAPATFVCADAQSYAFERGGFDQVFSRFGVMFFEDPVAAFANLRHAVRSGAELRCVVWRGAAENPFMTTAERAAAPLLRDIPVRQSDAPGQFAFADRGRVHGILERSGWCGIDIRPIDVECAFPLKELSHYVTRLGPLGRALHEAGESTRIRVREAVRPAFEPYVHGTEVRFTAACWMVGARNETTGPAELRTRQS